LGKADLSVRLITPFEAKERTRTDDPGQQDRDEE
jgi:hypothetical protein